MEVMYSTDLPMACMMLAPVEIRENQTQRLPQEANSLLGEADYEQNSIVE